MTPKKNKLAAGGAAVVMAAGLAIGAVGVANAAPAAPERITSVEQLHESLAQAVEQEQALGLQGTIGGPVGREVLESHDAIDG
ncbi:hypothetical protein [Streptomyces xanthophaeus]|uniref:Secreted protein n=2 Tax=Streptomyces xanthophaeus TaxID=67385 RepID=A0A919LBA1_9ACTN|nr:hypothetical protein [Streptomyces xanthophaeus]WST21088.1 hypothetical protein OG264_05990 [Streptomyces xanthophaeus]WST63925.1 hypothetical protein OG605_32370 [Streptomyces xanthophaeus]GHI83870.1 hypothetical protein Sxan_12340 [Streptomyces xanthophaeus]